MDDVPTHYQCLKVARDAPPEVIRAAYLAMSRKYHPDLHERDPQAGRRMAQINQAYQVLSDAAARAAHDRWIAGAETRRAAQAQAAREADRLKAAQVQRRERAGLRLRRGLGALALVLLGVLLGTLAAAWRAFPGLAGGGSGVAPSPLAAGPGPAPGGGAATAATLRPAYSRPAHAPSGAPWPEHSGDVPGFRPLYDQGQSTLVLENAAPASDLYAKLWAERDSGAIAVRWVFLLAGEAFALRGLPPGRYALHYRDLDTGRLGRTRAFELGEAPGPGTALPIRIPGAADGAAEALPESDF
jgi:hypothetical protein